jgi:cytoskeletal protein RodZ
MYAEFLGLNGTLYVDEYNDRIAPHAEEPFVPESLAVPRKSRLLFRTTTGVIVVAAIVAALNVFGSGGATSSHVQPDLSSVANAAPALKPVVLERPVKKHRVAAAKRKPPVVARIRAVTSRSWLSVRVGNANGKEVFRGFLNQGHHLTYGLRTNVWLRIGRPRAVAIRIGTTAVRGLPGNPANLLLTRSGPRAG